MKKRILINILIVIGTLALIVFGLLNFRYGKSQKYFSQDGQYSFYSKKSIFGITLFSMPGDAQIHSLGGSPKQESMSLNDIYSLSTIAKSMDDFLKMEDSGMLKAKTMEKQIENYIAMIFSG